MGSLEKSILRRDLEPKQGCLRKWRKSEASGVERSGEQNTKEMGEGDRLPSTRAISCVVVRT